MKVGVIGTGFGRRVVAPVFDVTEGCDVVDVVSARDEAAIAALVARPDVDVVSIHSPPFLHAPHVRLGLRAGKAVLCDKPFALDPDEADALVAEAHAAGVVALCNFEFRYARSRRHLRALVQDGTIGNVQLVHWIHESTGSVVPLRPWGWLFDAERGGGWIGAWASHAVDQLRFVFEADVEVLTSAPSTRITERPDANGVMQRCTAEDSLEAALQLSTGGTVAIKSSFAAMENTPIRFAVFGANATVEIVDDKQVNVQYADGMTESLTIPGSDHDRHLAPMQEWAKVVRDAVTSGEVPDDAPTFADGAACDHILHQLRRRF